MRAVAVLEWTGDLAHPKASRLIPISVWDGQQLQDGGIYLARPQPLALDSETEYELQKDGKNIGFLYRSRGRPAAGLVDRLGGFKALPAGPSPRQLAMARRRQKVDADDDGQRYAHPAPEVPPGREGRRVEIRTLVPEVVPRPIPTGLRCTRAAMRRPAARVRRAPARRRNNGDNDPSAAAPDPDRPRLHADDDSASSAPADARPAKARKQSRR